MGDREGSPVAEVQRARLVAAATEIAYDRGAGETTVSAIVGRARISRRSFYQIFSNAEECLLAAMQDALARARRRVLSAQRDTRGGWRAQMRASLETLLALCDECPQEAHLLVVESLLACPEALRLRERVIGELAAAFDRSDGESRRAGASNLAGEALVGAALAILHRRLLYAAQTRRANVRSAGVSGRRAEVSRRRRTGGRHVDLVGEPTPPVGRLIELAGPLMGMFVLPYQGPAAARRELVRPVAAHAHNGAPDGLHEAVAPPGIRLTSRTILVLSAIDELSDAGPGPSNRQIAVAAGVADQGQASKLLARLRRQGLIENVTNRPQRYVNAWRLTPNGQTLVRSLSMTA